jgi:murein DD-endopeptidase MepM/ murein hydrolase activator NlpD
MRSFLIGFMVLITLAACSNRIIHEAPIIDGWKQGDAKASEYRVQTNDSIYSIAWAFDTDYRALANANHLQEPYHLSKGQVLHLTAGEESTNNPPAQTATTIAQPTLVSNAIAPAASLSPTPTHLKWPTTGKITKGFSQAAGGNKGIDISGTLGQPIMAIDTGKVVYAGASLPGYGNLIIIKHNENQLSAYAFNQVIIVKEGQVVKAGQSIAKMGINDSGKPTLHFEIREAGKPVNPMLYYTART